MVWWQIERSLAQQIWTRLFYWYSGWLYYAPDQTSSPRTHFDAILLSVFGIVVTKNLSSSESIIDQGNFWIMLQFRRLELYWSVTERDETILSIRTMTWVLSWGLVHLEGSSNSASLDLRPRSSSTLKDISWAMIKLQPILHSRFIHIEMERPQQLQNLYFWIQIIYRSSV